MKLQLMHKNEDFFFNKIPSFIVIIITFLLITGHFLIDLAVSMSAILLLLIQLKINY